MQTFSRVMVQFLLYAALTALTARADLLTPGSEWSPEPAARARPAMPSEIRDERTRSLLDRVDRQMQKGRWADALQTVTPLLASGVPDVQVLIRAGQLHTNLRQYDKAESSWREVAGILPADAWVKACLGGVVLRAGRVAEARRLLEDALAANPSELVARYNMACCLLAGSDLDGARRNLRTYSVGELGQILSWIADEYHVLAAAVREDGRNHLCRMLLDGGYEGSWERGARPVSIELLTDLTGRLQAVREEASAGRWKEVEKGLLRLVELGVVPPVIGRDLAYTQFMQGRASEARATLEEWMIRLPDAADLKTGHGILLLETGDYAVAAESLRSVRPMIGRNTVVDFHLACALAALGEREDAEDLLRGIPAADRDWVRGKLREGKPFVEVLKRNAQLGFMREW